MSIAVRRVSWRPPAEISNSSLPALARIKVAPARARNVDLKPRLMLLHEPASAPRKLPRQLILHDAEERTSQNAACFATDSDASHVMPLLAHTLP
jgi:hypothetical protein